jgi:hypothetical protein
MPKRSNAFQQVVTLLHEQFASDGIVTESKFLPDSRTGKLREVDIVIESQVSEYPILLSVECIDHNRPATVEWIERMSAKHLDLPTDRLVLVSRSGFSREAQRKADALNITTLALASAKATDWTCLVGKLPAIGVETLQSSYHGFIVFQSSKGQEALAAPRDLTLHNETGTTHVLFGLLLDYIVTLPEVGAVFLDHMKTTNMTEDAFTLVYDFPEPMLCIGPVGENLVVQSLRIVFSAERAMMPVPLTHGAMRGAGLAYGEATAASGRLRVAVVERPGEPPIVEIKKQDGKEWKSLVNADLKTPGIVFRGGAAT